MERLFFMSFYFKRYVKTLIVKGQNRLMGVPIIYIEYLSKQLVRKFDIRKVIPNNYRKNSYISGPGRLFEL